MFRTPEQFRSGPRLRRGAVAAIRGRHFEKYKASEAELSVENLDFDLKC